MKAVLPACLGATFLFFFALANLTVGAPKPIALKVRPMIAFAPTDAFIQVRVHPGELDRWISVMADSGEFSRRSDWTIEGDRTLYTFYWTSLPAGDYDITARIGYGDTISAMDRVSIKVQGIQ